MKVFGPGVELSLTPLFVFLSTDDAEFLTKWGRITKSVSLMPRKVMMFTKNEMWILV